MAVPLTRLNRPRLIPAGLSCERCASERVRWLTPRDRAQQGAVLLCATCAHITIKTRRGMLADAATPLAA